MWSIGAWGIRNVIWTWIGCWVEAYVEGCVRMCILARWQDDSTLPVKVQIVLQASAFQKCILLSLSRTPFFSFSQFFNSFRLSASVSDTTIKLANHLLSRSPAVWSMISASRRDASREWWRPWRESTMCLRPLRRSLHLSLCSPAAPVPRHESRNSARSVSGGSNIWKTKAAWTDVYYTGPRRFFVPAMPLWHCWCAESFLQWELGGHRWVFFPSCYLLPIYPQFYKYTRAAGRNGGRTQKKDKGASELSS